MAFWKKYLQEQPSTIFSKEIQQLGCQGVREPIPAINTNLRRFYTPQGKH